MAVELLKTSVDKILHPQNTLINPIVIAILAASILVKLYMSYYNQTVGKKIDSAALLATATDSRGDCISTLLVLVSALISLFAGVQVDGYCGLIVGIFILYSGFNAAKDTISPLLGQAPDKEFVEKIYEASQEGQESTGRTVHSTEQMSEKIDIVFGTIGETINMLELVTKDVADISEYMNLVQMATDDVNAAMEQCSQDAEEITHLTVTVSELAEESNSIYDEIEEIDFAITHATKRLYKGMNMGITMLTNNELIEIFEAAKAAHKDWANRIISMLEQKRELSIQTDATKCAFGHYYYAINMKHSILVENWKELEGVHTKCHAIGKSIIEEIKAQNYAKAEELVQEGLATSEKLNSILDTMISSINEMTQKGEAVF